MAQFFGLGGVLNGIGKRVHDLFNSKEKILMYLGLGVFGSIFILASDCSRHTFSLLSAGTRAYTNRNCVVATETDALEKYEAAEHINDTFGMTELIKQGGIFPLESGTSLLVLESSPDWRDLRDGHWWTRRVRILDGPYEGKAGWLADRFMTPGYTLLTPSKSAEEPPLGAESSRNPVLKPPGSSARSTKLVTPSTLMEAGKPTGASRHDLSNVTPAVIAGPFKDQSEYDLHDSVVKDQNPETRLEKLRAWKDRYPTSNFDEWRQQAILATTEELQKSLDLQRQNYRHEAYKIGGGVSAPVPIFKPEPEYSEEARKAKLQGTVVLFIVVDEKGHPHDLKVIRPLGLGLDQKAIEAVQKWWFRPGMKDGHAVPVQATIQVNFRLL